MRRIRTLASVVMLVLAAEALHAATAWFGLSIPRGLSDPHRAVVDVSKVNPPAAQVPAGEDRFVELGGKRIQQDVAKVVGFSQASRAAGDRLWGRVTGFPAAKATLDWTAAQLKSAGMKDVQVQEYAAGADTAMWWASAWEAKLLGDAAFGAGTRDVVLASAVPTSGSMMSSASLTAPMVFVGSVTDERLPEVDVKGKVAVQHLKPQRGAYSERTRTVERAKALSARGAVAVLNVVEQTGNMHIRDFGNCGAPCFNLGTADGVFLEQAMERAAKTSAPLRIQLSLKADRLTGLKGHNAVGIVPGKRDEIIIVNAHADGWYDAAGDNADGLAVLLAMARHFAKPEHQPERTLVFVASGGHHSTGLNGPAAFVKMNAELAGRAVMVLNLEHIAQFEFVAGTWNVNATEQPMNFGIDNASPYLQELGQRAMQRYGFRLNPQFTTTVAGDLGGYSPLGVARVQAIHSGPMYHASGDVLDTISIPGLERAARFYTYFVTEAAKAPREQINPAKPPSKATAALAGR
jgi:hypothetical protein